MSGGIIICFSLVEAFSDENSITIDNDGANWHISRACSGLSYING
jgi:hypothetical protein